MGRSDDCDEEIYYMLSPLLKDLGLRANVETHGDETSFELIRMIEEIGPDILGVTLDRVTFPLVAMYRMTLSDD